MDNSIGDVVQSWRKKIDLEAVPMSEAPFLMETLQIPHTYCWSPALVPKPKDWGKNIGSFYRLTISIKLLMVSVKMFVDIFSVTLQHTRLHQTSTHS